MKIRVLHLYHQYLNIYADRGNIAVFEARCAWRGIECEVRGLAPGETFDPADVDLVYVGGGQDRDQAMIAEHMARELRTPLHEAAEAQVAMLAVCGGYQLLGEEYLDTLGVRQPGVGVLDLRTEAGNTRMIGNVAIEAELPAIGPRPARGIVVAGFENHAGRTSLADGARPLGKVLHGYGNDGRSGFEGCTRDRVVGTYLHGPLLPRNPELADWLIAGALAHAHGEDAVEAVTPLDDALADAARSVSVERARAERRVTVKG
jgi:lipid II isoglutaminyl synthase (glutamine-hydrolysing)